MSSIHYFQRYSQPENVTTNNTLLLFSRLYHQSPTKFKSFLNDLIEDVNLEAGIFFYQQERNNFSIPDGTISQTSFKIIIETKMHTELSTEQLEAHLNSFKQEDQQILLSLSIRDPNQNTKDKIKALVANRNEEKKTQIIYIPTTFQEVVKKFKNNVDDRDIELLDIIADFEDYCLSSNLISNSESRLRVVNCALTFQENLDYNLYYAPALRGYSEHSYLGIYKQKSVRAIGKIDNIITADLIDEELRITGSGKGSVTDIQKNAIMSVIPVAMNNNGFDIKTGYNFFFVEKFYETDFKKDTKHPLLGTKFFDLKSVLKVDKLPETKEIALLLSNRTWQQD